jgi:hypothetical protein
MSTLRTRNPSSARRGVALISALIVMAILLVSLSGLVYYANLARARAINVARDAQRMSCAEAGLQLAKSVYGRASWQTLQGYLQNPAKYNAVGSTMSGPNPAPAKPLDPLWQAANPDVLADLDQDGLPDVYIYIRDDQDELAPNLDNWLSDNNQKFIVGALCISTTMTPRGVGGRDRPAQHTLALEALLSQNQASNAYTQGSGGDGSGNYN